MFFFMLWSMALFVSTTTAPDLATASLLKVTSLSLLVFCNVDLRCSKSMVSFSLWLRTSVLALIPLMRDVPLPQGSLGSRFFSLLLFCCGFGAKFFLAAKSTISGLDKKERSFSNCSTVLSVSRTCFLRLAMSFFFSSFLLVFGSLERPLDRERFSSFFFSWNSLVKMNWLGFSSQTQMFFAIEAALMPSYMPCVAFSLYLSGMSFLLKSF